MDRKTPWLELFSLRKDAPAVMAAAYAGVITHLA